MIILKDFPEHRTRKRNFSTNTKKTFDYINIIGYSVYFLNFLPDLIDKYKKNKGFCIQIQLDEEEVHYLFVYREIKTKNYTFHKWEGKEKINLSQKLKPEIKIVLNNTDPNIFLYEE